MKTNTLHAHAILNKLLLVLVHDEYLGSLLERTGSMRGLEHEMRLPEKIQTQ